ncbi:unnamed protein product, partial [Dovyalis caffra]
TSLVSTTKAESVLSVVRMREGEKENGPFCRFGDLPFKEEKGRRPQEEGRSCLQRFKLALI